MSESEIRERHYAINGQMQYASRRLGEGLDFLSQAVSGYYVPKFYADSVFKRNSTDYIERQDSCKSCGATDYDFDGKVSACTYCKREYTEIAG